jgi:hypothetical protein
MHRSEPSARERAASRPRGARLSLEQFGQCLPHLASQMHTAADAAKRVVFSRCLCVHAHTSRHSPKIDSSRIIIGYIVESPDLEVMFDLSG